MNESKDSDLGGPRIAGCAYPVALVVPAVYFSVLLLPKVNPAVSGSFWFFLYSLSMLVALCSLFASVEWGGIGLLAAWLDGRPVSSNHRRLFTVGLVGLCTFVAMVWLCQQLPRPLPSSSDALEFSPIAWQASGAADYVESNITPRQKMLGSLVEQLDSSMTRNDLEAMLGPPAPPGWPHGAAGSDLHYFTGLERDSFFGLDGEWLLIYLDDSGHFGRCRVYVD